MRPRSAHPRRGSFGPRGKWLPLVLVLFLAPLARSAALTAEGSLFVQAGPTLLREDLPSGSVPDWTAQTLAGIRISGAGPAAELAIEALYAHDVVSRSDMLFLEEAWAAWKPVDGFTMRFGRQRLGFGCGFAWSVVDDLDPQPMPFDPHLPRVGLDAFSLSFDFTPLGAPVKVAAEAFAPRTEGGGPLLVVHGINTAFPAGTGASLPRLADCGAAAQVSAFLGGFEIGAAGSIREFAPDPPISIGGWVTVDIAGFVLGAEGAWRNAGGELLVNCNRRAGDFAAVAETRWVAGSDRVWLFGQVSWSRGDLSAAVSTLFSLREASGLADLGLSYTASDALVLSAGVTFYERPDALPEIGPSPYRCAVSASAEYFF